MGSSPIARSIFSKTIFPFLLKIFILLFSTSPAYTQMTVDIQRPFNQGQLIEVPGTSEYLGDIPQDIVWISNPQSFHTLDGLIVQQVGWSPDFAGAAVGSPGVMFEGLPYPFSSSGILSWMSVFQYVELLNFPVSAWWGPSAATGAVQIRLPESLANSETAVEAWGGFGGLGGVKSIYGDSRFFLDGNFQHGLLNNINRTDTLSLLSGTRWRTGYPLEITSGFLGAQWFGGDHWYSLFGSLKWASPNFQSLEWKPFFQSAGFNGANIQEIGSNLNYHFTMAGLAESQLGLGISHDDFSGETVVSKLNKGYVQNFDAIDVLGDFKLNLAFRLDFSSVASTFFSTSLGGEYRLGDILALGTYSKAVDQVLGKDTQQSEFGIRCQPGETWTFTCKYTYDQIGTDFWSGPTARFQWRPGSAVFGIFQKMDIDIEEQILIASTAITNFDTGGRVRWNFFNPIELWVGGRDISNQGFYTEGGITCSITSESEIYASVENAGNYPISWPDPTTPQGRMIWFGAEIGF